MAQRLPHRTPHGRQHGGRAQRGARVRVRLDRAQRLLQPQLTDLQGSSLAISAHATRARATRRTRSGRRWRRTICAACAECGSASRACSSREGLGRATLSGVVGTRPGRPRLLRTLERGRFATTATTASQTAACGAVVRDRASGSGASGKKRRVRTEIRSGDGGRATGERTEEAAECGASSNKRGVSAVRGLIRLTRRLRAVHSRVQSQHAGRRTVVGPRVIAGEARR